MDRDLIPFFKEDEIPYNFVTQSLGGNCEAVSATLFIDVFIHTGKMSSETLHEKL